MILKFLDKISSVLLKPSGINNLLLILIQLAAFSSPKGNSIKL